jgi:hypothetical protein
MIPMLTLMFDIQKEKQTYAFGLCGLLASSLSASRLFCSGRWGQYFVTVDAVYSAFGCVACELLYNTTRSRWKSSRGMPVAYDPIRSGC